MESFQIEVDCILGGTPHKHTIVVEHGDPIRGVSPPANVRLQYTCPVTGTTTMVYFQPPVGAGRPFTIAKVS